VRPLPPLADGLRATRGARRALPALRAAAHKTWLGPDRYDWEFCDLTFGELRRLDVVPIADLCHFGVPDWVGDFQNPDFPGLFAGYAGAFARRYPWVQLHTPVNEMFVCATFSALYGWWNEQLTTDRASSPP
jgi:beta-glucosidase/6-phospho-beta-glucosidase/beta-galactosidase